MFHSWLDALVCVIIESSSILESLLTCLARKNHSIFLALHLELVCEFLEMNADKVDKAISLADILILTALAWTLERLLGSKCLWVLKFHMNIKNTLLRKALRAVLARMRKNPIMPSKMIMHCGLILSREIAMIANKLSVAVLGVNENHLCGVFDAFHRREAPVSIFARG